MQAAALTVPTALAVLLNGVMTGREMRHPVVTIIVRVGFRKGLYL